MSDPVLLYLNLESTKRYTIQIIQTYTPTILHQRHRSGVKNKSFEIYNRRMGNLGFNEESVGREPQRQNAPSQNILKRTHTKKQHILEQHSNPISGTKRLYQKLTTEKKI